MNEKNLLEEILTLNFLEINNLILNLENKLNIDSSLVLSANNPVSNENNKDIVDSDNNSIKLEIILTAINPDKKISVLKTIKNLLNLGLKESKEIVDNLPKKLKETVDEKEAKELKNNIEQAGGVVDLIKI